MSDLEQQPPEEAPEKSSGADHPLPSFVGITKTEWRLEIIGTLFAGVGTVTAAVALFLQVGQISENTRQVREAAEVNRMMVESLALEKLDALRGTQLDAANDWSVKQLSQAGIRVETIPLTRLRFSGYAFGACDRSLERSPGSTDNSATWFNSVSFNCLAFPKGVSFANATFGKVTFDHVDAPGINLSGADLNNVVVIRGDWGGAKFSGLLSPAHLQFNQVNLSGADFNGVEFRSPGLSKQIFTNTKLEGADFRSAKASGVGPLNAFKWACVDQTTRLSNGTDRLVPTPLHQCICDGIDSQSSSAQERRAVAQSALRNCRQRFYPLQRPKPPKPLRQMTPPPPLHESLREAE